MTPFVIPSKFTAIDGISHVSRKMANNVKSDFKGVHDHFNSLGNGIARQERLFRRLTPNIGNATKQLLAYGSAATLLGAAGYSGKEIMNYETAEQSLSAVTGVQGQLFEKYKKNIHETARETKKLAKDIAGGYEVVGSAMSQYLDNPEALDKITEAGVTLSKASRQDLVPTLENLTSIMNQFNLVADQSNETINRLTAGEIVGSLKTSQVSDSLKAFGANAYTANVSLSESVALVEALAKQRPAENLGIDARNLLIVMDSAKALDSKAKNSLKRSGVDMTLLADKTKTLSQRLHELRKIQGDSVGMIRVFGERNVTAAKVIFNQLDTYDKYLADILRTNEAQRQATTNTQTFEVAVDQLKNTWINYLVANEGVHTGLDKLKTGIKYVTNNIDEIVTVGINAVKFFALWKAAIVAQTTALGLYNISIGVSGALTGVASVNIGKSTLALNAYNLTTKLATASTWNLNAAIAANPVGVIITGLVALAGARYFLTKQEEEYLQVMEHQHNMNIAEHIERQSTETMRLAKHWQDVGFNIKDATVKTLQFQVAQASDNLSKAQSGVSSAEQNAVNAYDNSWFPAFSAEVSRANAALSDAKNQLAVAQADKLGTTNSLITNAKIFGFSPQETNSILNGKPTATGAPISVPQGAASPAQDFSNNPVIQEMNKNIVSAIKEGFKNSQSNIQVNLKAAGGQYSMAPTSSY
jgi:TP901 family phage tail tape measure protein